MHYIITNIQWDTDGMDPKELKPPSNVTIDVPDDESPEDYIADFLSDKYGFCICGYNYEPEHAGIKNSTQLLNAVEKDYEMLLSKGKKGQKVMHMHGYLDGYAEGVGDTRSIDTTDIVNALVQYRQLNINWWKHPEKTAERLKDFIGKEPLKIETSGPESKIPSEDTITVTLTATQQRQILRYLFDEKKKSGMQIAKMNPDDRAVMTAYIESINAIVKALSL